jgi:hypothetical protein
MKQPIRPVSTPYRMFPMPLRNKGEGGPEMLSTDPVDMRHSGKRCGACIPRGVTGTSRVSVPQEHLRAGTGEWQVSHQRSTILPGYDGGISLIIRPAGLKMEGGRCGLPDPYGRSGTLLVREY